MSLKEPSSVAVPFSWPAGALLLAAVLLLAAALPLPGRGLCATPAEEQPARSVVCIVNDTDHEVAYGTRWSTSEGESSPSRHWFIKPHSTMRHYATGASVMDAFMQTGGERGMMTTISLTGTTGQCGHGAICHIRHNNRGFLRFFQE